MQQQFQCPGCQSPVMYGDQFCSCCGTSFAWQQFQCPGCQSPVMYGAQFCNYCDTPLTWQQEMMLPPIQQQSPQYSNQQERGQQLEWNQPSYDYQQQGWEDPHQYHKHYAYVPGAQKKRTSGAMALVVILLLLIVGGLGVGVGLSFTPSSSQSSNLPKPTIPAPPPYSNPAPLAVPAAKLHDISLAEIQSNPEYWNITWQGRTTELQKTAGQINQLYLKTHTYIKGQTDCNDMTVDIWNMLKTAGIASIIVAGNLEFDNYTFAQCNHSWLLIYLMEKGETKPKNFILESTNGQLYFNEDIKRNPQVSRYEKGFFYAKPSDLREDFKERW
jgi:hypothetical protein